MTMPSDDRTSELLERILATFDRLMHRLMATHAPELNAIDLTMAQTKAMYIVLAAGQLRMSELAARLGITSSTATGQVDRLVELGLLERHEDPADRRQVVVTATDQAEVAVERFRELNSLRMREMLANVAPRDLGTVERALRILEAAVPGHAASAPSHPDAHPTQHEGPRP
jgi:MarR family transcriptional regulator, organic hydroperoxide resistance regulator